MANERGPDRSAVGTGETGPASTLYRTRTSADENTILALTSTEKALIASLRETEELRKKLAMAEREIGELKTAVERARVGGGTLDPIVSASRGLMHLPDELLVHIAEYLAPLVDPERDGFRSHDELGIPSEVLCVLPKNSSSDALSKLSRTCRRLFDILTPILLRDISVGHAFHRKEGWKPFLGVLERRRQFEAVQSLIASHYEQPATMDTTRLIAQCINLRKLAIWICNCEPDTFRGLLHAIGVHPHLSHLDLDLSKYRDFNSDHAHTALQTLTSAVLPASLTWIVFRDSFGRAAGSVSGVEWDRLWQTLNSAPKLSRIDLHGCGSLPGIERFPVLLGKLYHLHLDPAGYSSGFTTWLKGLRKNPTFRPTKLTTGLHYIKTCFSGNSLPSSLRELTLELLERDSPALVTSLIEIGLPEGLMALELRTATEPSQPHPDEDRFREWVIGHPMLRITINSVEGPERGYWRSLPQTTVKTKEQVWGSMDKLVW